MIDDAIEVLTKMKIKQSIEEHEKGIEIMIQVSKVDLIGLCIKVLKVVKEHGNEN